MRYLYRLIQRIRLFRRYKRNRDIFENYFKKIVTENKINNSIDKSSEDAWIKRWGIFGFKPTKWGWKAFSGYMNGNIDLVPNDVARNFIEPILTPEEYQPFYNDKNSLAMFVDSRWLPRTYFRSMDGKLYDGEYGPVRKDDFGDLFQGLDKLVVKPAKDMGGKGVSLFCRIGDDFVDDNNNKLTLPYLEKTYKTNYLIQECLKQSNYMSQFNPSSVNTLRIATYRDVTTGRISVIGAVLRIGGKGSFVDNASSGGSFVSINENGKLGKFACNEYGVRRSIYNDIDFENNEFMIPDYDRIKKFVCDVAKRMPHMSLFANDVAIDENGNPRLIEVNTIQFSYWLYQLSGKTVFGKYTDELLNYCFQENKKLCPAMFLKYN